jgi:hypothetical protein
MPIPNVYRRAQEGAVASYDWTDIADGSGYVVLDCYTAHDGTATTYSLTRGVSYSQDSSLAITSSPAQGAQQTRTDNYTTNVFNRPARIKGNVLVLFSANIYNEIGGSGAFEVAFYKVDSANVETQIGNTAERSISSSTSTSEIQRFAFKLNSDEANIKIGDRLRLKFTAKATFGSNRTTSTTYFPDPILQDDRNQLGVKVFVPFKIDP